MEAGGCIASNRNLNDSTSSTRRAPPLDALSTIPSLHPFILYFSTIAHSVSDLTSRPNIAAPLRHASMTAHSISNASNADADVIMTDDDPNHEQHNAPFPFWLLPAELRTQVYEELLVTDASFRLGHHGPFCLVPRKCTYPAILRTSRRALMEAAPILYGANSFFLGECFVALCRERSSANHRRQEPSASNQFIPSPSKRASAATMPR